MQRLLSIALALVCVVAFNSGCGDSRESLAEESVSTMKQFVAVLDTVKDEASAKAAKPELEELARKMESIDQRANKLGMPSEEQVKAMDEKHGKEMDELMQKMAGNMMRIAFDPKIQAVLGDIDLNAMK